MLIGKKGMQGSKLIMLLLLLSRFSRVRLCDPVDGSLPGSAIPGILQARTLEWVAISFCRDLPNPGIEARSPALQADALPSEPPFKHDLNKILYTYTVEVTNRFKGLELIDCVNYG